MKGCDASILLDGTTSEKASPPNRSVRGFDLIEAVKAKLESFCAGVVSCADIIAMVTRDAVELVIKFPSSLSKWMVFYYVLIKK